VKPSKPIFELLCNGAWVTVDPKLFEKFKENLILQPELARQYSEGRWVVGDKEGKNYQEDYSRQRLHLGSYPIREIPKAIYITAHGYQGGVWVGSCMSKGKVEAFIRQWLKEHPQPEPFEQISLWQ
jgi:hypothetical protein